MWQAAMAVAFMCGAAPLYAAAWLAMQALLASYPVRARRWADERMYAEYQEYCRLFFQLYTGTKYVFHGDAPRLESAIYMSNHQCTIDWLIVPLLASQVGLAGSVRYVLKNALRLMPCYGWYFEQHGCVYVRKDFVRDEPYIRRALHALGRWTSPVWLAIFPEGTRFSAANAAALVASQAFSKSHGRPPLSHVLVPRTKGFVLCVQALRDSATAVYDVTVAYHRRTHPGHTPAPSMAELMAGDCPVVHVFVRRHSMAALPASAAELAEWLHTRFVVKDRLLALHFDGHVDALSSPDLGGRLDSHGTEAEHAEACALLAGAAQWTHSPPAALSLLRLTFWMSLMAAATLTRHGRTVYGWSFALTALGGLALQLPLLRS